MIEEALKIILPGLLGNVGAWISGKLNVFKSKLFCYPLDLNIELNGKRLLGKNKTFRGLFASTIIAAIVNTILGGSFYIGCLMGFSTSIGDGIKSFFKRRLNIVDGKDWYPFDLMDVPIGYCLFVFPMLNLAIDLIVVCCIFAVCITYLTHYQWRIMKFKK